MSKRVETGLAEMSGIHMCEAPKCGRQLKPNQGKTTPIAGRQVRTCFSSSCVAWVNDRNRIDELH